MYSVYVGSNYKRTLWFKNKVWNKNIKYKIVYISKFVVFVDNFIFLCFIHAFFLMCVNIL